MKKIHYICICILAVAGMVMYSCMKDNAERHVDGKYDRGTLTVEEAKEFFESFVTEFKIGGGFPEPGQVTRSGKLMPEITPIWSKGKSFNLNGSPLIEVPLTIPLASFQFIKKGDSKDEVIHFPNTKYYLLAEKTDEVEILYYVVTYTADAEYMMHKRLKVNRLTMSDMSSFSGRIMYYDLSGNFIGGRMLKDGCDVGESRPLNGRPPVHLPGRKDISQTRGWEEECHEEEVNGGICLPTGDSLSDWGEWNSGDDLDCSEETGTKTVCTSVYYPDPPTPPVPPGGGGSGGGGTGSGSGQGPTLPNNPDFQAKFKKTLEKLKKNCMGAKIASFFEANDALTVIDGPSPSGSHGGYSCGSHTMYIVDPEETWTVLEEMMHAYQCTNSHSSIDGDFEIEAKLIVYNYITKNDELDTSTWKNTGWDTFASFAKDPSEATWSYAVKGLQEMGYDDPTSSNYNGFYRGNFDTLKNGCN